MARIIGIYGKFISEEAKSKVVATVKNLVKAGLEPRIFTNFKKILQVDYSEIEAFKSFAKKGDITLDYEVMISFGGDGTLLEVVNFLQNRSIPILGVNTGRLGFLATTTQEDLDDIANAVATRAYDIQERFLLSAEINGVTKVLDSFPYALNEIAIQKKDSGSMITIHTEIDGHYLNSYWADGLIVSTPTGSTAYSLSCGGPIVVPGTNNIVLTPIAPHNLNVRPIVVNADSVIKLKIEGRASTHLLSLDSRSFDVENEAIIVVKKGVSATLLVQLKDQDFFNTLRNKLLWGLDKRN